MIHKKIEYLNARKVGDEYMKGLMSSLPQEEKEQSLQTLLQSPEVQNILREAVNAGIHSIRGSHDYITAIYYMEIIKKDGLYQFGKIKEL